MEIERDAFWQLEVPLHDSQVGRCGGVASS